MEAEARLSKPQPLGPGSGPPQASAEAPAQQMQGCASGRAQLQAETGSHRPHLKLRHPSECRVSSGMRQTVQNTDGTNANVYKY